MTIDEAIKNEEEAVEGNEKLAEFYYKGHGRNTALGNACRELADERRQLAAWLTELKQYKDYNVGEFCDKIWKRGYERGKAEAIKALPPVTPQPKAGYISIDDVMSVFDDFMCGEVDEDETDTFLEMLKNKAESE